MIGVTFMTRSVDMEPLLGKCGGRGAGAERERLREYRTGLGRVRTWFARG